MDSLRDFGARGVHAGFSEMGGFKKFILRGNVVDLAIGVVIGVAFNTLVQGFVTDIIQPLIGLFGGTQSFDKFTLGPAAHPFLVGHFLGLLISFLITALVIYFFVVRPMNALRDRFTPHKEAATPTTRECPFCLSTVPLRATRCAYCTAQLPPSDTQDARAAQPAPQRG